MSSTKRIIALSIVTAGIAAALVGVAFDSSSADPRHRARPKLASAGGVPFSATRIPSLALAAAAQAGDATPNLIQHSRGTRGEANRVASGDIILGKQANTDCYLVAMRGHFTARALDPLGAPTTTSPTAYSVVTLVIDATTGQIVDSGMSNSYPDLGALGAVTTDGT